MTQLTIPEAMDRAMQFHRAGNLTSAEALYRQVLAADPDNAEAMHLLGVVAHQLGRNEIALELMQGAFRLQQESAYFFINYGEVFRELGRIDDAIAAYRRAVELEPKNAVAWNNLGACLVFPLDEAITCLERALELDPDYGLAYGNLISVLKYQPQFTPQKLFEQHLRFARRLADPLRHSIQPHNNLAEPERSLRIGFVSPDFREHSVMYFLEPFLRHANRQSFVLYGYSNSLRTDSVTQRIRSYLAEFRTIISLSDQQATDLVRSDGIDILVDLAGHTRGGRLLLFARKPAPVQVSYLGYPCTTGLSTVDYRVTDAMADPPGLTEAFHTERLIRLPETFLCYEPPSQAPPVAALPADATGHITFGSFNNLSKVSDDTVRAWAALLAAVPRSRLVLKALLRVGGSPRAAARISHAFAEQGVTPDRLSLLSHMDKVSNHLAAYGQIDIALDTFPYNGTTTTCEAMWMGVPVVVLEGNAHISRVGVSLMNNVGLPELIARDAKTYVQLAADLAADRDRLRALRGELRQRLANSVLLDAPRFTRRLEDAFRGMWREWCASRR